MKEPCGEMKKNCVVCLHYKIFCLFFVKLNIVSGMQLPIVFFSDRLIHLITN